MRTAEVLFEEFLTKAEVPYEIEILDGGVTCFVVPHNSGITLALFDLFGEFIQIRSK